MDGRVVKSLCVICTFLVCRVMPQNTTTSEPSDDDSVNDPTAFSKYMLITDFKFGKLEPDVLNPGAMLVIRPMSVARLTVSDGEYGLETVVGSESEKDIVDATGTDARFDYLFDVAQIPDQRIWIGSELTYNCLRKIDVDTLDVSTFSGTCTSGAVTQPYVGDVAETKWTLPGLMIYVAEDRKLYISSNGGLRVIDMQSLQVEVLTPMIATIYDMILTSANTLLLLHSNQINELNPSNSSNIIERWNKADAPEQAGFSFIFGMARVDESRYFIVDDKSGLWLLNIETGELTDVCPDGMMTLTGSSEEQCYDSPSNIQHISYINNNLNILSHWQSKDIDDSTFELGIFLHESSVTGDGGTAVTLIPDDNSITKNATDAEADNTNSTLLGSDSHLSGSALPDSAALPVELPGNTTSWNMSDITEWADPTWLNDTMPLNMSMTDMPDESTSNNESLAEMTSVTTQGTQNDATTRLPAEFTDGLETTERSLLFNTFDNTKYQEEKTPEITTPSEKDKPGKSDTGSSTNTANQISARSVCWSLTVAVLMLAAFQ